jgi:hypothetical protein
VDHSNRPAKCGSIRVQAPVISGRDPHQTLSRPKVCVTPRLTPPLSCGGAPSALGTGSSKSACRNVAGRTLRRTGRTAAAHASPASTGSSPGCVPATREPPHCGIRGTTTNARSASSNSAETRPKDPFSRTSSSVLRPVQASIRVPSRAYKPKAGFLHRNHVFSHGARPGCAARSCWWEASPPPFPAGATGRAEHERFAYYEASSCCSPIHGVKLRLSASL